MKEYKHHFYQYSKLKYKLKPYPFCGSINLKFGNNWCCGNDYVLCVDCEGMIHDGSTLDDSVVKWNNRK